MPPPRKDHPSSDKARSAAARDRCARRVRMVREFWNITDRHAEHWRGAWPATLFCCAGVWRERYHLLHDDRAAPPGGALTGTGDTDSDLFSFHRRW